MTRRVGAKASIGTVAAVTAAMVLIWAAASKCSWLFGETPAISSSMPRSAPIYLGIAVLEGAIAFGLLLRRWRGAAAHLAKWAFIGAGAGAVALMASTGRAVSCHCFGNTTTPFGRLLLIHGGMVLLCSLAEWSRNPGTTRVGG